MKFSPEVLRLDTQETIGSLATSLRSIVHGTLRRKGAVVGLSGGVDSSVCAALCVRALGNENVLALLMPERESSPDSVRLGRLVASFLGISSLEVDITPILQAAGCYRLQAEAIRSIFPEYGEGWTSKVSLPSILEGDRLNITRLVVRSPGGDEKGARMPLRAYLNLIAATNFKQRTRKMLEYYHADRMHYAVCGTPNRLEYDQGFFVKNGDGSADVKPIAHLYKTQVYALAEALGIPDEVRKRPPTTDTFSMVQTQEEFFFALPYHQMDLCLYAHNNGIPTEEVAPVVGLTAGQVAIVYKDIETKRRTTLPLQLPPLLVSDVTEVHRMVESVTSKH